MIVLLGCSINLLANNEIKDSHPFTGEVVNRNDSVLISYDDLRLVNSKLIELEYERQINNNLRSVVTNDSIIIRNYKIINQNINKDCKKAIRQRNIAIGSTMLFFIATIILIVK